MLARHGQGLDGRLRDIAVHHTLSTHNAADDRRAFACGIRSVLMSERRDSVLFGSPSWDVSALHNESFRNNIACMHERRTDLLRCRSSRTLHGRA